MKEDSLSGLRFLEVTVLNSLITILEFVGGLLSGSLSLLSDAVHNLGDSLSIIFSYAAHLLSRRKQTHTNTYGFKRAEILSALFNSIFLVLISVFLMVEALSRIQHPERVHGGLMFVVAVISTIANLGSTLLLHRGSQHNLNMKATYLHLLSDTLSSLGIIVGALLIQLYHWTIIDPLITLVVSFYILWECWPVIRRTISILMEAAPRLDYPAIKHDLLLIDGVYSVHHVHALMVDENSIVFSAHVNLRDMPLSSVQPIYDQINQLLKSKYQIKHVTIQPETTRGADEALFSDTDQDV
ncbi:Cobalt-zinc-cadmium resistance protein CzcD [Fructilactobacillus florum 8D]|uniref:Cobalt-zinc-cadmium resistance protein CzcD n=1 Tax=Fructilactobacillus florum 8D TaxID=1221538 RepID=W9EHU5_9LACO|nr:cation diffusion facilitator family transporter [Fructilactobacillus florum]EKK20568.1 Cobalt-zinc-cadmium resistance protein CzcD [Fructilactobacillus florum 2F]ETO40826.1 Cobalt-zinc-cadmium resistance protein CzcD [Fructilactobacillus florum 8D]